MQDGTTHDLKPTFYKPDYHKLRHLWNIAVSTFLTREIQMQTQIAYFIIYIYIFLKWHLLGIFHLLLQEILAFTFNLICDWEARNFTIFWQKDISIPVGHPPSADFIYGEEGSISPST